MMLGRIVLFLVGLIFTVYGLVCLIDPESATRYSGLVLTGAKAEVEVAAMYGGLQIGLGTLFIVGAFRSQYLYVGLVAMLVTLGSLALGRGFGLIAYGLSTYNLSAFIFESIASILGVLSLRQLQVKTQAMNDN